MRKSAFARKSEFFCRQNVTCSAAASYYAGSRSVNACVRSLRSAQTEFYNAFSVSSLHYSRSLRRYKRLMPYDVENSRLQQLSLRKRRLHYKNGLAGKNNFAFYRRIYFARKLKVFQIVEKSLVKRTERTKIVYFILSEMQIFHIIQCLFETCENRIV